MAHDSLTVVDDEYVRDRFRWVAELSAAVTVYGDDWRPGWDPGNAWTRLKAYCEESGHYIIRMRLQFRSHSVDLPDHRAGYFFRHAVFGIWGVESYESCWAGTLEGDRILVTHYKVPELVLLAQESRDVDNNRNSLIARPI